jgi:hypothetical protein
MKRRALDVAMRSFEPVRDNCPEEFYVEALTVLSTSGIPFLVGGAYGLARYLGVDRETKDLDIFICPGDIHRTLGLFRALGYRVDLTFPHWLGKVYYGSAFIDLIFSSGNSIAQVDGAWFTHARDDEVLGVQVKICPPEEMLWSKAFVQERERFDGADVMHLLLHFGEALDWTRLLERFGPHWRVLLGHIVSFGFVYPDQRHRIPIWVTDELTKRFAGERSDDASQVCNGTLLSREQYLYDIRAGGYQDARVGPTGRMTPEELEIWTAAIDDKEQ